MGCELVVADRLHSVRVHGHLGIPRVLHGLGDALVGVVKCILQRLPRSRARLSGSLTPKFNGCTGVRPLGV